MFGKSFANIRKDFKNGNGLEVSLFSGNKITKEDSKKILAYNQAMKAGQGNAKFWAKTMGTATQAAQDQVKACIRNKGSLEDLANSYEKVGLKAKAAQLGMNLLATAINIGITFVLVEAIQLVYQFVTAQKQLQKVASETGSAFAEKAKDIDEYKTKIAELQKTINDSSSSYQESYNAREQLLTIQDEIIEKYGKEKGAVDAVTEAIKGNITALDEFTQKSWQETVNDFDAGKGKNFLQRKIIDPILNLSHDGNNSQRLYDSLENAVVTFKVVSNTNKETQEKFDNLLKDTFNASIVEGLTNNEYTLSGNLDDIYDKLLNIQSVAENMGFKDSALSNLKEQASNAKDALEDYDDYYSQHILNDKIRTNEDYLDVYNEIEDVYKKYSDAFKSGDTDAIEKAKQEYAEVVQAASNSISDQSVLDYFNKMHSDLQAIVGTWEFEVKFKAALDNKGDTFDEKIQDALSKFDNVEEIKHFEITPKNNQEQIEAYAELTKYADAYGLSVDQLISELEKLGQIQSVAKQDLLKKLTPEKSVDEIKEAQQNLKDEYQKISDWGLDDYADKIKNNTIQTKFGNVDMDKRTIIKWSDELKQTYADALASWDYDPEIGSIDTVFGGSERFGEDLNGNGWEVAFTPILPDGTFLSKDTVEEYINSILEEAYADDGKVTEDELTAIDAQGRQVGNTFVQGIFAGIDDSQNYDNNGNWAEVVGRLMHFAGKTGAVQLAKSGVENNSLLPSVDKETLSNWINSLTTDEAIFINDHTKEFTDAINERIKNLGNAKLSAEDLAEAYKAVQDSENDVKVDTPSFASSLSSIQALSSGLSQLDKIYADVYNKKSFDWSSILNNKDFSDTFGNMTNVTEEYKDAYDNFIKTISNNPSDLKACQSAFDDMATAYIYNSDALKNLTEENANAATQILKEQGVANASEIVNYALAASRQYAALAANKHGEALYQEINDLIKEDGQIDTSEQNLIAYTITKEAANNTLISTDGDISNLIALIGALGASCTALQNYQNLKNAITSDNFANYDPKSQQLLLDRAEYWLGQSKQEAIDTANRVIKTNSSKRPKATFTGGNATQSAKDQASKGSGGSGKDKDSGKDEFTDWFDLYIKEREEYIEAAKNKVDKLQKELERALKLGDEESIKTIGEQLAVANADYQKVISDSASELRSKMQNSPAALPLLFSLAPELKDIKIDDWTPRLIQKIKDNISDDTKASTFETLTSTIKKAYEYVGDKNGEGSWAQDFADAYSTVDDMLGNIFDKWKDGQDKIIDGIDKQIDKVDDLIDGYDDTIDRIENMNALQGDSIENVLEEASAYNGKLLAYQQKDAKLQEKRIALLNKQKEIELQIQNIKSYGLNDLETVETLQKLNDELDSTNEELVEVGKNISDNNKDALSFFKEIQDAIVDKLKEIYELQKEQAEDALDKSQEKRKKDLEDQQDAALKALEDEKQAAVDASEATSDKLQEELDLLQKRNDELKDATEYYDKLANLQKIYRDKSHAYIDETTGKEVLTYDREAAKEAEAGLEDWLSDKVYNNAVDNLQDQIDKQKDYTDQLQDEYDKRIDALKEAQEKETEALEKTLEREKEAFDEYWDQLLTDERLNAEARALIQEHGAAQALEGVNKLYKDTVTILDSKKQDLYNEGEALSNKFLEGIFAGFSDINKGVSDAIDSIFKNRDWSIGLNIKTNIDAQTASDTLKQMYDNSLKWKEADIAGDTATKISLAAENQKLGKIIGADYNNGSWTIDGVDIFKNLKDSASQVITLGDVLSMSANNLKDSNTALSTEVGKSTLATIELSKTQDANREEIIKQMYANSQAWKVADEAGNAAEKKIYSDANKELAEKIGATWNTKTWGWDIDGKNIYDSLKDKTEESAKATEKNTDSVDNAASATTKLNQTTSVNNNNVSNNTESVKSSTEATNKLTDALKESNKGSDNKISDPNGNTGSYSSNNSDNSSTTISTNGTKKVVERDKVTGYTKYTYYKADGTEDRTEYYNNKGNQITESQYNKGRENYGAKVYKFGSKSNGYTYQYSSTKATAEEALKDLIAQGKLPADAYVIKHDGIKSGLIGDNKTLTSKEDILRRIATGKLKPDEQLVIAQKAEGIFTPTQMENLANALLNGYNLNLANTAKAPTLPNITPVSTQTIEKGDTVSINTLNVTTNDFDTLMRQIRLRAGRV